MIKYDKTYFSILLCIICPFCNIFNILRVILYLSMMSNVPNLGFVKECCNVCIYENSKNGKFLVLSVV